MDDFYSDLTPTLRFADFADTGAYTPVPPGWVVLGADIAGSTRAIEAGRYKDVNMIGAAAITAVLNVAGKVEVPFVFGGDGATLVVPPSLAGSAGIALLSLRKMAMSKFGMELRVGAVPVAALRARGKDVRVRKYQLSPGNFLAMFTGGGVELADTLLKNPPARDATNGENFILADDDAPPEPDLEGLSCRWEPLTPKMGKMLAFMVRGTSPDAAAERALMGRVLEEIASILGRDMRDAAPASRQSMKFRWPPRGLKMETLLTAGKAGFAKRYAQVFAGSLVQFICEKLGKKAGAYDPVPYGDELRANTDFRKYDDVLRMVLDVSPEHAGKIEAYLESQYRDGHLVYGTHVADTALMTCVVFSLQNSEHVHFVDGSDGGFAMAAIGFKKRLAALNSSL
ncbi:MAG: DUF3095 domain-containing protein [Hyphomicrobiales bacterium]